MEKQEFKREPTLALRWFEMCAVFNISPDHAQYRTIFFMGALACLAVFPESNKAKLRAEINAALAEIKEIPL